MNVTIYKTFGDTSAGYIRPIEVILDRIKTGRKKTDVRTVNVKEGRITWTEDFLDEDTVEFISIERSHLVAINGKRVDPLGRAVKIQATLIETSSDKKAWDEFPLKP